MGLQTSNIGNLNAWECFKTTHQIQAQLTQTPAAQSVATKTDKYGAAAQETDPEDTSPTLDEMGVKFIQQVAGSF